MARVTDVFVKGSVENIIFYRRMGKSCARIKRSHIKQTEAVKMRGTIFGVVTAARLIYNEIENNQLYQIENERFMPAEIIDARYEK
jgi:hypothetical protein